MAAPKFDAFFLPFLKCVSDGEVHHIAALGEKIADHMQLTAEDRSEKLPSGQSLRYRNRIGWTRTYVSKAGLIESPERGKWKITERGAKALAEDHDQLDVNYLMQFPKFLEFSTSKKSASVDVENLPNASESTPEELLEESHVTLKSSVQEEILGKVKAAPPEFFESLVVELLVKMGYGGSPEDAGRTIGGSGDGGVDGGINEDRLGLDVVYVQAKRWENTVGRPVIQAFAGSLEGVRARKGVVLTTSDF
jgi:restriction system protein